MPYVLKKNGVIGFPDENFAREVMQLFSIGLYELNMDGTLVLNNDGLPILTYSAEKIQTFARAWTGFALASRRSNVENYFYDVGNRIDPMIIKSHQRDYLPKLDLYGGYIGDRYPLCMDLPAKHFLRKGATYRLLGSSMMPLLHSQPTYWFDRNFTITKTILGSSSDLRNILCNDVGSGCEFSPVVTLEESIVCSDIECEVDDLRLVQVSSNPDIYYEYVRLPCVELTFYENSKTIQTYNPQYAMCANGGETSISNSIVAFFKCNVPLTYTETLAKCLNGEDLPLATDACCENPNSPNPGSRTFCAYSVEKTTFETSKSRCSSKTAEGEQCAWNWQVVPDNDDSCHLNHDENYYW